MLQNLHYVLFFFFAKNFTFPKHWKCQNDCESSRTSNEQICQHSAAKTTKKKIILTFFSVILWKKMCFKENFVAQCERRQFNDDVKKQLSPLICTETLCAGALWQTIVHTSRERVVLVDVDDKLQRPFWVLFEYSTWVLLLSRQQQHRLFSLKMFFFTFWNHEKKTKKTNRC